MRVVTQREYIQRRAGTALIVILLFLLILTMSLQNVVLALNGDSEIVLEVGEEYLEYGAISSVNNDLIEIDSSNVDTSRTGVYEVIYRVSDETGVVITSAVRKVTVIDTTLPEIVMGENQEGLIENRTNLEYLLVGWEPISLEQALPTSNIVVNKPEIEIKKASIISWPEGNAVIDGDEIKYNIEIKNNSNLPINSIEITDIIPDNTILIDEENPIYTLTQLSDGRIQLKWLIDLNPNEIKIVSFAVLVNSGVTEGEVRNIAIVDGIETNENINPIEGPPRLQEYFKSVAWARSEEYKIGDMYGTDVNQFKGKYHVTDNRSWTLSEMIEKTPIQYFETQDLYKEAIKASLISNIYNRSSNILEKISQREKIIGNNAIDYIWDGATENFFARTADNKPVYPYGVYGNNGLRFATWLNTNYYANNPTAEYYSMSYRRFTTYLNDINQYKNIESISLACVDENGDKSNNLPLNDAIYLFVNGKLAWWASTYPYSPLYHGSTEKRTMISRDDNTILLYPYVDGWVVNIGEINLIDLMKDENGDIEENIVIDIICEDYYDAGGMNKVDLYFK